LPNTIAVLNLSIADKANLVAFLKALTDDRVRWEQAPFDHPSLSVPNGHPFNEMRVLKNGASIYAVVTTGGGTSSALVFTVNVPPPTLASIAPALGVQGASVPVTINGTNLTGAALNLPAGVTTSAAPVVTATQITATLVVAATAATGPQNITVTTVGGTSSAVVFTVNPPPPTLASLTPASGVQGTSVPVTITGTNLTGAALNLPAGVTASAAPVVTATQITATLAIAATAAAGPQNITVTTAGGTSAAVVFTVNQPMPTLSSIAPASGVQGASVPVTIAGANLTGTVLNLPAGITTSFGNPLQVL
jgi:hypothetical protein